MEHWAPSQHDFESPTLVKGLSKAVRLPVRPAIWEALASLWRRTPELAPYQDTVRVKAELIPEVIDRLAGPLAELVESLPDYYVESIRPAAPFLFREWMPIGYSAMLTMEDPSELRRATLALMNYGVAVTVLDDVADTDAFDRILGPGSSDIIAQAALAHVFPNVASMPEGITARLRPIIELVRVRTDYFLRFLRSLDNYPKLESHFNELLQAFFQSVVLCRRVRKSMLTGEASHADLVELAATIPHGMTVALIGLVGFAYNDVGSIVPKETFLRDAQLAQVTCHYQNAIATLQRELREGDPSNPIVLDAIQRGLVDQRDYVNGRISTDELSRALDGSRTNLANKLEDLMTQVEARREDYQRLGMGRFFKTFGFGVWNLSLLYRLAWGRV
jgi:hypothetical protein